MTAEIDPADLAAFQQQSSGIDPRDAEAFAKTQKAQAEPTGYFGIQRQKAGEGMDQLSRGVGQLSDAFRFATSGAGRNRENMTPEQLAELQARESQGVRDLTYGVGNVLGGGINYVASPIEAGLRYFVGNPIQNTTGIPREYPEFALGLVLPIPKRVPGMGSAVKKLPPPPSTAQNFTRAENLYKEYEKGNLQLPPQLGNALADHVVEVMKKAGAYEHLAPEVHGTVDLLRRGGKQPSFMDRVQAEQNWETASKTPPPPLTTNDIKSYLEALSTLKANADSKVRRAAGIASEQITSFLSRVEPRLAATLEEAKDTYAVASRGNQLDQAAQIARLRAGRAGYGGNSVNSMRQVLSPILESSIKGNAKGWSPQEIAAIRDIVEGTTKTDFFRGVGQLSPSKGSISSGLAFGTLGVTGVIGALANKAAAWLTSRQIDRLNELVRSRSPAYAERVAGHMAKMDEAANAFRNNPSQANLSTAVNTSRSLAALLARDGMEISSGDFLRLIGAKPGRADEENP